MGWVCGVGGGPWSDLVAELARAKSGDKAQPGDKSNPGHISLHVLMNLSH